MIEAEPQLILPPTEPRSGVTTADYAGAFSSNGVWRGTLAGPNAVYPSTPTRCSCQRTHTHLRTAEAPATTQVHTTARSGPLHQPLRVFRIRMADSVDEQHGALSTSSSPTPTLLDEAVRRRYHMHPTHTHGRCSYTIPTTNASRGHDVVPT
jgi:hypothetical protein